MKIAIAQLNPTIGDLSGNAKNILEAARQAAKEGVRLMLTPELSLCGYPPRDLLLSSEFVESMSKKLHELAQQLPTQIAVLVGTAEPNPYATSKGQKPLFNGTALLEGGKLQKIFYKRLLPTYDVFDEDRYFEPGYQTNSFTIKSDSQSKIHIGVTICEDLWNEEEFWGKRNYEINPIEDLAELEVDLIVNLSASPYTVSKQKLREAMLSHSASRYQTPIIYVNQIGGNDDLIFDGNSVAFNRTGNVVCRAKAFASDLKIIELDEQTKDLLPTAIAPLPETEEEEIFSALVLGVRDYARKCGFSQVVLGLSGGIDSSLVAAIAAEAMGAENVLGVLMPSPYSSEHSITDAEALVKNLGIKSQKLPIGDLMKSYDRLLEPLFAGTEFGIAEENTQSRIRGNLLMAISNKFGHLLLSTGNKSEMAVGYCTLYGDMNGGLAVIADVPKTRVFSICRWLNRTREIIPNNVLIKSPSAELKPGQVDQDSLPPYEILDDILERAIHHHQSTAQIVESGHDLEVVDQVMKLIARAEFKRKQAPPGLKITDRAFGTGWRMPIASRWLPPNPSN
ncbi:NAD+ synthetase [Pleurocapsa sp. PCC 7327]|uniref:NAD+ synthase n=1 Tax=Pleurocapsa sp. PCC 7327 TaxID=118163 RepID=UPI00029FE382|nr:NAD+ synthase [Pleurocapsa sp. PCC 7327]AFY76559.1 NAD+ synthetase [Pleurocapsa sp. PCC 7327]